MWSSTQQRTTTDDEACAVPVERNGCLLLIEGQTWPNHCVTRNRAPKRCNVFYAIIRPGAEGPAREPATVGCGGPRRA